MGGKNCNQTCVRRSAGRDRQRSEDRCAGRGRIELHDVVACSAQKYPERFFNMGIAEANMIGAAARSVHVRFYAVVHAFAMFMAGRGYDQIRNSICYPNLNVKCVGTHGGLSVGEDGATHQCVEDIALMRAIPNMTVICPADANETRAGGPRDRGARRAGLSSPRSRPGRDGHGLPGLSVYDRQVRHTPRGHGPDDHCDRPGRCRRAGRSGGAGKGRHPRAW